jgi:hypothetical protein
MEENKSDLKKNEERSKKDMIINGIKIISVGILFGIIGKIILSSNEDVQQSLDYIENMFGKPHIPQQPGSSNGDDVIDDYDDDDDEYDNDDDDNNSEQNSYDQDENYDADDDMSG